MASDSSPSPDVVEVVAANDGEVATNASQRESKAKTKRKRETISTSTATSKASRERSWVWDHFTKYDEPLIEIVNNEEKVVGHTRRAQCMYCSTNLACDSRGNGTSSLSKHIEQVCKGYPGRANLEEDQQVFTNDGKETPSVVMRSWTQENCVEAACVMIVMDELPFSFIEKPGFRYFCSVAVPRFNVPCRKVIVKNFLRMYNAKKEELKRELQSHCVCLTTDTWTSCQNINYMVITAHFIDCGWKMHKRVLNFCVIPNHQGNTIGKILENCLVEWSIENLLTVSVDNASANTVAIDYLRKKMMTWEKKPIFAGKYMHVRCLAHIVNLIVRSGLAILEKSVASIRNAVKYVRSSSSRLDVFKKCVAKEKLESKKICVLDVPTRWNSTFIMLDTALELRKAFDRMAEEEEAKYYNYFDEDEELEEDEEETEIDWENWNHPKVSRKRVGPPIETDWAAALVFVKFLKVFYDVTVRVSASLHPTSKQAQEDIERNENATASTAAVAEKVADSAGPSKPKTVKAMKKKNKRLGAVNL
ncbi:hypothetical protein M0R45_019158 [Rubus argutus]|uniref:BED-type domain-containing protein n=1 Tax=Rubus argutus TaxID=59490 RepID=A0AAW1X754_RUBAR